MNNSRINFKNVNLFLIFIIPFVFFVFGLKKQSELHEKLMIQGIGIDLIDNQYKLTVQAYDFKNPEKKDEPKIKIIESIGETVSKALENLKKITGLTPFYSQNKIIIIGLNTAKSGIHRIIDFFTRFYENRPSTRVRISEGEASEIFKGKDNILKASEMKDLVDEKCDTNILKFEKDFRSCISAPSMLLMKKNSNELLVCENLSIFKGDKLEEVLDENETLICEMINNNQKIGTYDIQVNDWKSSFKIQDVNTKIKVKIMDNIPKIYINIKFNADLLEITKEFDKTDNIINDLKEELDKNIENKSYSIFEKFISKGYDLFNLGKHLKNKFPNYFKEVENEWKNGIFNIKYDIRIDSKISMIGIEKI